MSSTTTSYAPKLQTSFTKKRIDVTFHIPDGSIAPGSDADTVTLTGHRVRATVTMAGFISGSQLSLRIEGMTLAMMNRLSVVQAMINVQNQISIRGSTASVTVQAGDDTFGLSTIFRGTIAEAFVDFSGAPNVAFQVLAWDNQAAKLSPTAPTSYAGTVPAATIFSDLASRAPSAWPANDPTRPSGVFNNHSVTETVTNFYGCGTVMSQIDHLARSIGAAYAWDVDGALNVWSKGDSTDPSRITTKINKSTGLVGYPAYNQNGVAFTCLFNPTLRYRVPIRLESEYLPEGWVNNQMGQAIPTLPATGVWSPYTITHDIASETPGGPWFSYVSAVTGVVPQASTT
ncbi:hypothetical protein MKW11_14685 [Gluconobacter frateurii]|uniref:baseplate hub protein n=1 Tax=Gluconobacter frateurii TaxID=38308 RepID=UPI001F0621B7|nr:hypothetical protein [Gluconobacter frateurii]UMM08412.1 hypothetical protein MKW11_14685 [Gluconobacter frateurii]